MSEKRRASNRLRVWVTFGVIFGMMALLLLVEARLALPTVLSRLMQFAIVVLTYGLLAIWINADAGATIR
ncbi:MAG: hypothetical protein ISS56_12560 [Anaerolineae bacterium]|nr:hypothetical protein [Anaerolineae bacterium]